MTIRRNHLEKMETMRKNRLAAGLMSERFPTVSGIVIHMTYFQKTPGSVLMERTVNFYPSDYAYFDMRCMARGCENGGFDLAPVIKELVKDGKKSSKGFLSCHSGQGCHASIAYQVVISYSNKKSGHHHSHKSTVEVS